MANERLNKIKKDFFAKVVEQAAEAMDSSIRQRCQTCGRGGINTAMPTIEDLEALCLIRDGFDGLRKDFSPEMKDHFDSFDRTINYLHIMIAGSSEG